MRVALAAVGFDYARPDPRAAWAAFRDFITRALPGLATISVGVECYNAEDRDDVLWLEFARVLERPGGSGCKCGCLLSRPVPAHLLGISQSLWWWKEHGTLAAWAVDAERLPAFSDCLALSGWRWEGFSG